MAQDVTTGLFDFDRKGYWFPTEDERVALLVPARFGG